MATDYTKLSEKELREIKRKSSSRSPEFAAASKELNRRAEIEEQERLKRIGRKSPVEKPFGI